MIRFVNPQFMILLTSACQASCKYCFGPNKGPIMDFHTAESTLEFIEKIVKSNNQDSVSCIFHGGEPFLAPYQLWVYIVSSLTSRFGKNRLNLSVQSNLWNLDNRLIELLKKYDVKIGTSIDGPRDITDLQRGSGYYKRTMEGIQKAKKANIPVSSIATFTALALPYWKEIIDFFIHNEIDVTIHPAIATLEGSHKNSAFLSCNQYSELLINLIQYYVKLKKFIKIPTFDPIISSITKGEGELCTFKNCFGSFIVVNSDGYLYPCQRFCGIPEYSIGHIINKPNVLQLQKHPNAQKILHRENEVQKQCENCSYYLLCRGGCFYSALSGGTGVRDPFCEAYKNLFHFIQQKLIKEAQSSDNLQAISHSQADRKSHPLFRKGDYTSLAKSFHPADKSKVARKMIGIYELSKGESIEKTAEQLIRRKISKNYAQTLQILDYYKNNLLRPQATLNNMYAHITLDCNLRCNHCYIQGGDKTEWMSEEAIGSLLTESNNLQFRQFIVTGGEPLIHPYINKILKLVRTHKNNEIITVLRTNLVGNYSIKFLRNVALAFNRIIVSVDGDEECHDKQRGAGTYKKVVNNIVNYNKAIANIPNAAELSIACTVRSEDIKDTIINNVFALGRKQHIKQVRFRPILPLGRASLWVDPLRPNSIAPYLDESSLFQCNFSPVYSCGIGQNLYIKPNGDAFPCYAYDEPEYLLGNALTDTLNCIISANKFNRLSQINVNTIAPCKGCEYRYFCGGICKVWKINNNKSVNLKCTQIQKRVKQLINDAYSYLFS